MNHESQGGDIALGNFGLDVLGIPGFNGGAQLQQRPALRRHARLRHGGCWCFATSVTNDGWDPVERDERTYAFAANVTKMKGAHELRFGYSLNRLRMDHWQPELGSGPRGHMSAGDRTPRPSTAARRTRTNTTRTRRCCWASQARAGTSVQYELMTTREWQHNMYVRDRWQVNEADPRSRPALRVLPADARAPTAASSRSRRQRSRQRPLLDDLTVLLGGWATPKISASR